MKGLAKIIAAVALSPLCTVGSTAVAEEAGSLYVNTGEEHYSIPKSRQAGEKDLFGLTAKSDLEEAWFFVEYADGTNVWYEHGMPNPKNKELQRLDERPILDVINSGREISHISFYHFHPVSHNNFDASQTPSIYDFRSYLAFVAKFHNTAPEYLCKIDFRIVVSSGEYMFSFDERILHDEKAYDMISKRIQDIFLTRISASCGLDNEFDYSQDNKGNFDDTNMRFAKKFDSPLMRMRFEPRKNIVLE